jgi:hypothetical protein
MSSCTHYSGISVTLIATWVIHHIRFRQKRTAALSYDHCAYAGVYESGSHCIKVDSFPICSARCAPTVASQSSWHETAIRQSGNTTLFAINR